MNGLSLSLSLANGSMDHDNTSHPIVLKQSFSNLDSPMPSEDEILFTRKVFGESMGFQPPESNEADDPLGVCSLNLLMLTSNAGITATVVLHSLNR